MIHTSDKMLLTEISRGLIAEGVGEALDKMATAEELDSEERDFVMDILSKFRDEIAEGAIEGTRFVNADSQAMMDIYSKEKWMATN